MKKAPGSENPRLKSPIAPLWTLLVFIIMIIVPVSNSYSQVTDYNDNNQNSDTIYKENSMENFLVQNGYVKIALAKNSVGHFVIKCKVNGHNALFILDTGASGTCIDFVSAKKFNLKLNNTEGSSFGVGGDSQDIKIAKANLEISDYKLDSLEITAIDLTSVNEAYTVELSEHIDGVIGADILFGKSAIIDYGSGMLYLKK